MPICSERELPDKARMLWQKAKSAAELKNHGYAASLIQTVLRESPGFLDGRKALRAISISQLAGKKTGASLLGNLTSTSFRGSSTVKKDPLAAMEMAEKTLENDPYNAQANHLLKDAAMAAGFPEIAIFSLETLLKANPKDTRVLHELGEIYLASDQNDKALEVYNRIGQIDPGDLAALKKAKDAAASATLKSGGWETAKSYRDLIKNKDEATSLEQSNRTFKDVATIDAQLGDLSHKYEQQPQSVDVVRQIAQLMELKYEQTSNAEDLAGALQWFSYCNELLNSGDPAIARKVSDLQNLQTDLSIKALEDWFKAGGDQHPDAQQYRDQLQSLVQQKADSRISEARKRIERNPTDLQLRFELGEELVNAGQFTEAIAELQRARQNPNVRLRAMTLLGRCFVEKGMLDLAVQQLKGAASEMIAMDAVKKDTVYRLALLHEKMGKQQDYLDCLKEIYEADYNYMDVAARVESSYSGAAN